MSTVAGKHRLQKRVVEKARHEEGRMVMGMKNNLVYILGCEYKQSESHVCTRKVQ